MMITSLNVSFNFNRIIFEDDGCSSSCQIEPNYECPDNVCSCIDEFAKNVDGDCVCGNGIIEGSEECDDDNLNDRKL